MLFRSEAVERYDPSKEAAILLEVASGYQLLILSPEGYDYVGGLTFEGFGLHGPVGEVEDRAVAYIASLLNEDVTRPADFSLAWGSSRSAITFHRAVVYS